MGRSARSRAVERFREVFDAGAAAWVMPSRASLMGLHLGTREAAGGAVRAFRDDARLWEAYWRDELPLGGAARAAGRVGTVGRLLASSLLPRCVRDEALDAPWTWALVYRWLREAARAHHVEVAARCSHALERLGDAWLSRSGASWCADDLRAPAVKRDAVDEALRFERAVTDQYQEGQITDGERYNKIVDGWSYAAERVASAACDEGRGGLLDAYAQAERGRSTTQRRLCGMVGLVAKPTGEVVERPVAHSFGEGLDAHEVFVYATGRRAFELGERARFREIGELFEELCVALGDLRVVSRDCGAAEGVTLTDPDERDALRAPLYERAEGRTLARDLVNGDAEPVASIGDAVGPEHRGAWLDVSEVTIRAATTCREPEGVCAACYGRDPDDGTLVRVGAYVGLRAAWAVASLMARMPGQWGYDRSVWSVRALLDVARGGERLSPCDGVVTEAGGGLITVAGAGGRTWRLRARQRTFRRVGDVVCRGDALIEGTESLRQRLRIMGEAWVAERLVGEFEHHAAWGGHALSRVHWELVARAMLAWRRVRDPGDTGLRRDEVLSRAEYERAQRETIARGGRPAEVVTVIRGVGRMAGRAWMLTHRERMEARG